MYYATEAFRTICYSSITLRCPDSCKGSLGEIIYLYFSTLFKFKGKKSLRVPKISNGYLFMNLPTEQKLRSAVFFSSKRAIH